MTSTTVNANAANGLTFFDLPPEIRNAIYGLALPHIRFHFRDFGKFSLRVERYPKNRMVTVPTIPGCLNASLRIAAETLPMFYSSYGFIFRDGLDKSLFLTARGQVAKKHLKHIVIHTEKCVPTSFPGLGNTKYLEVVVYTEEEGTLDIHLSPHSWDECICEMVAEMGAYAVEKCRKSNGDSGLAYAAVECFFDKHLPRLQDEYARFEASRRTCGKCKRKEFVYQRGSERRLSSYWSAGGTALLRRSRSDAQ
ncbi:hypothetical protein LTR10_002655 [Elasticomyces elasticus]|nr:hypothetical protein LTR10_002655 [Elasticomyces elasticus]KAK4968001.1 hypothetical protein LTR42_010331 [Elasticomyces elasticus]